MFVGLKMLRNFVTATPKTLVKDAQKILDESKLWMLLILDQGKLVGYVRKEDINAALPSIMTSLEKHEINYLMSKLTVDKILRKDIKSIAPETEIEAAAELMHELNLAGLAVVDHQGKLLGYINRSVMLDVLVGEMGHREGGARITFEVEDRPGGLARAFELFAAQGVNIEYVYTSLENSKSKAVVIFKVENLDHTLSIIREHGIPVVTGF